MSTVRDLTINIDGAARGNPGPAAFAYVIAHDGQPVLEDAGRLGTATNNVAEYTALVRALERAATLKADRLLVRSDSELLVKQMNGEYKVKNASLRDLYEQARALCAGFASVTLEHVRREHNKRADQLCNAVLDGKHIGDELPEKTAKPTPRRELHEPLRAALQTFLRGAAKAWARGNPDDPDPYAMTDRLWELLAEHGVVNTQREE